MGCSCRHSGRTALRTQFSAGRVGRFGGAVFGKSIGGVMMHTLILQLLMMLLLLMPGDASAENAAHEDATAYVAANDATADDDA